MKQKVILVSIDGMRPDGVLQCGHPFVEEMRRIGSYTLDAQTVFPSVTLPCHMSMFHSITPQRHGVTTNTYTPPVRPVNGLFEQVKLAGGISAMFYGWEQLRDLGRPGSLMYSEFVKSYMAESVDTLLTDRALACIQESQPDFVFLYLVDTDEKGGHDNGWMTEEYLRRIQIAIEQVRRVHEAVGEQYAMVITADHGGHERNHGTDLPEDMTIPMFFLGKPFEPGRELHGVSLLDLAPTITSVMGIPTAREWEGRSLVD